MAKNLSNDIEKYYKCGFSHRHLSWHLDFLQKSLSEKIAEFCQDKLGSWSRKQLEKILEGFKQFDQTLKQLDTQEITPPKSFG